MAAGHACASRSTSIFGRIFTSQTDAELPGRPSERPFEALVEVALIRKPDVRRNLRDGRPGVPQEPRTVRQPYVIEIADERHARYLLERLHELRLAHSHHVRGLRHRQPV